MSEKSKKAKKGLTTKYFDAASLFVQWVILENQIARNVESYSVMGLQSENKPSLQGLTKQHTFQC